MNKITPDSSSEDLIKYALLKLKEKRKNIPGLGEIEQILKNALHNLIKENKEK
jgi:hypothetical protein